MEFNLYYYLRTDKVNKVGEHPINLFYVFKRKTLKIPLSYSVRKEDWLPRRGPIPKHKNYNLIMRKMGQLEKSVLELINHHNLLNGHFPTTIELKTLLNKKKELNKEKPIADELLIIKLLDRFISKSDKRGDKKVSTLNVYRATREHWIEYEKSCRKKFNSADIGFKLLDDFNAFLINKGMMFSTVGKYIKTLKTFCNFLIDYENLEIDMSFRKVKVEREVENNFVTLSEEEYEIVRNAITYSEFMVDKEKVKLNPRERIIGKIFLFMCTTGMSYVDLMNLSAFNVVVEKKEKIKKGSDVEPDLIVYLKYDRQKVKKPTQCIVPIHRHTLEILLSLIFPVKYDALTRVNMKIKDSDLKKWIAENINRIKNRSNKKFESEYRLFPNVSNPAFNREIKLLCQKIGLDEKVKIKELKKNGQTKIYKKYECISSHTGRRTYVTLCLKLGIRPDILMKSTGHRKMDTMRRYNEYTTISIHDEFENKIVFQR
jgi:integrase